MDDVLVDEGAGQREVRGGRRRDLELADLGCASCAGSVGRAAAAGSAGSASGKAGGWKTRAGGRKKWMPPRRRRSEAK